MKYQHIRNATALIDYAGKRFLIDPAFAPKGFFPAIPASTNLHNNPLVDLPLSIDELCDVDAVIVTHMHHFDHFDPQAIAALNKTKPMFTQNSEEQQAMQALGFTDVRVLLATGTLFEGILLSKTETEHGQESAQAYYQAFNTSDEASGVVFESAGEQTLYLVGDSLWNDDIASNILRIKPHVVVLNAALAAFADDAPILMGLDGIENTMPLLANDANIVVVHLGAVNHARLDRDDVRQFIEKQDGVVNIWVPEDGQLLSF